VLLLLLLFFFFFLSWLLSFCNTSFLPTCSSLSSSSSFLSPVWGIEYYPLVQHVTLLSELLLLLSEMVFIQNFLACVTERGIICRNKNTGFCFHFKHFSLLPCVVSDNNHDFKFVMVYLNMSMVVLCYILCVPPAHVACMSECVVLLFSCLIVRPWTEAYSIFTI
jgi:hypothetical protein